MHFKPHNYQHIYFENAKCSDAVGGLEEFKKSIELRFFADVTLKTSGTYNEKLDLVLELDCPLNLLDVLGHFNKGLWGSTEATNFVLAQCFNVLLEQNKELEIDIQEFTLYLKDTNVIIKNIYRHSIPEQFNNIITEIAEQYVSITKGLTEQPEEIFIPVFEDPLTNPFDCHFQEKLPQPTSYNEYWGIYLDTAEEGEIFDVRQKKFISANLDYFLYE
ncbi:hypothetical protein [Maribacter aurantiacus]|uniref:Uncharacterized protein n=1 Tax=Maribacter aurantiacus TaxID=1882343 RepID=A0A5R8M5X5_9FLAO|nr:hypothetical protein [Maribacter aurantiacus]TLF44968.1 hypothetical protein FEK29_09435 [Maribacter aurantiacus]